MDKCDCPTWGYCPRHDLEKSKRAWELCQSSKFHREMWDKRTTQLLGDRVEIAFKGLGITQDKYKEIKGLFGLPPECACDKRKEWLNKVHKWWLGQGAIKGQ